MLMWKAEMSNQRVPWEKSAQRPELYHSRIATVGKPQIEIPKMAFVMLFFFFSFPSRSKLLRGFCGRRCDQ